MKRRENSAIKNKHTFLKPSKNKPASKLSEALKGRGAERKRRKNPTFSVISSPTSKDPKELPCRLSNSLHAS